MTDPAASIGRSRWPRRLLWAAVALVAVVLIAAVALPRLIDVNNYRSLIQTRAEQALGRPVKLGEMSLSVFPSIAIRIEDPEVQGLLRARSLSVGVRLLPLLRGAVELRHVALVQPELTIARREDGAWEAGEPAVATPTAAGAAPSEAQAPSGQPASTSFSLSRLVIEQGVVHLTLHGPDGRAVQQDLSLDVTGSLHGEGLARLGGELEGRIEGEGMRMDAAASFARSEAETSFDLSLEDGTLSLPRLRLLAQGAGMAWPLPEGVVKESDLQAKGTVSGRFPTGGASRLEVRDARVTGLDVSLVRNVQGRWNVESLWQPAPAAAAGGPEAAPQTMEIVIHDARLEEGGVRLRDETAGGASNPAEVRLDDVALQIEELAPGKPIALKIEAAVAGGGSLRAQGTIPGSFGASAPVDVRLTLTTIPVAPVSPWLAAMAGIGARSGSVSADVHLSGTWPARVRAEGKLSVDDILLAASRHEIDARARFDLAAIDGGARTEIASLQAASGGSELQLQGWIDNHEGATRVDLTIPPAKVQPADVLDLLAVAGAALPVEFSSPQPIEMEAHVKGEVSPRRALDLAGRLTVAEATFRHPSMSAPLRNVRGTVTLRGNGFEVSDFSADMGGSDLAGTLAVQGFDAPKATFQLTSRRADFWELMSFVRQPQTAAPASPAAPAAPAAQAPAGPSIVDRLTARGTLKIGEGSFGTLDFARLGATCLIEGRTLRLDPVDMSLYGGDISGSATMDMRSDPPVYTVSTSIRSVDSDALLTDNLGMKGALAGALTGEVSVSSSGASQAEALRKATGGGEVKLANGRIGPINVLKILSRASDVLGERSLEEISGKLAREGTDFSLLTATLKVAGGRITTGDLHLESPDMELRDDGTLDMMAATIQMAGEIVLSEEISLAMKEEESRAAEYFWDSRRNRVNLPLKLAGPITAPMPTIDWNTAGENLARRKIEDRVREKLGGRLGGLLGGGRQEPAPSEARASEQAARAAGDAGAARASGAGAAPAAPQGEPSIAIEEKRFSGNLLKPDLKLKGTLRGTGLKSAAVLVKNEKGDVIAQESLEDRIASYYATADRAAPASISFRLTLQPRKSLGISDDAVVTITAQDEQGRTAESTFRVER